VDDDAVIKHIDELIEEEHRLRSHAEGGNPLSVEDSERLATMEVQLDQCWDLLRNRRARRRAGQDPDEATTRPAEVVERYRQ
jgi:Protein of unknown function (DUF2630)